MFTDGGANIRAEDTLPEAIRLRVAGAKIVTMSVGTQISMLEMMGIASKPEGTNVITTASMTTMDDMIERVVAATCNSMFTFLPIIKTHYD